MGISFSTEITNEFQDLNKFWSIFLKYMKINCYWESLNFHFSSISFNL